jgi:hypothetical protein
MFVGGHTHVPESGDAHNPRTRNQVEVEEKGAEAQSRRDGSTGRVACSDWHVDATRVVTHRHTLTVTQQRLVHL